MAQQKVVIPLPKHLKPNERRAVAQEVIDFIIKRTQEGKSISGKKWSGKAGQYSAAYKKSLDFKNAGKSKLVNLTLSDEMLQSIKDLSDKSGSVTIGYEAGETELNSKVEGNRKGTYGQKKPIPGKARDFLGIKPGDLKRITDRYPKEEPVKKQERVELIDEAMEKAEGNILDVEFELGE